MYIDEIKRLKELLDEGAISDQEFNDLKEKIIKSNINEVKKDKNKDFKFNNVRKFFSNKKVLLTAFIFLILSILVVFVLTSETIAERRVINAMIEKGWSCGDTICDVTVSNSGNRVRFDAELNKISYTTLDTISGYTFSNLVVIYLETGYVKVDRLIISGGVTTDNVTITGNFYSKDYSCKPVNALQELCNESIIDTAYNTVDRVFKELNINLRFIYNNFNPL